MVHTVLWMAHHGDAAQLHETVTELWRLAYVGPPLGLEPDAAQHLQTLYGPFSEQAGCEVRC